MYSIESHVGRLIEVRFWSPVGEGEAMGWRRDHDAMLQSVLGNYIVLVDMTDANVFPPDMVEAYVATMRNEPRLLRAALVLSASPTLSLQIQRILRDAFHPHRRTFRDVRDHHHVCVRLFGEHQQGTKGVLGFLGKHRGCRRLRPEEA